MFERPDSSENNEPLGNENHGQWREAQPDAFQAPDFIPEDIFEADHVVLDETQKAYEAELTNAAIRLAGDNPQTLAYIARTAEDATVDGLYRQVIASHDGHDAAFFPLYAERALRTDGDEAWSRALAAAASGQHAQAEDLVSPLESLLTGQTDPARILEVANTIAWEPRHRDWSAVMRAVATRQAAIGDVKTASHTIGFMEKSGATVNDIHEARLSLVEHWGRSENPMAHKREIMKVIRPMPPRMQEWAIVKLGPDISEQLLKKDFYYNAMVHGSAYSTRQLLQIAEDYARVDPEASVQMLVNSTLGGEDAQGPEAMMRFFDRIIERDLSNNESPESASSILSMAIGLGIDVFRDNVKRMKRVNGIEQTELHTQTERLCDFLGNAYGKLISLKDFQSPDDAIDAIKNAPFNGKNRMLYRHEAYATVAAALARQGHLEAAVTLVHSTENAVHEGHPGLQQTAARAYADVANGLRQRRLSEQ